MESKEIKMLGVMKIPVSKSKGLIVRRKKIHPNETPKGDKAKIGIMLRTHSSTSKKILPSLENLPNEPMEISSICAKELSLKNVNEPTKPASETSNIDTSYVNEATNIKDMEKMLFDANLKDEIIHIDGCDQGETAEIAKEVLKIASEHEVNQKDAEEKALATRPISSSESDIEFLNYLNEFNRHLAERNFKLSEDENSSFVSDTTSEDDTNKTELMSIGLTPSETDATVGYWELKFEILEAEIFYQKKIVECYMDDLLEIHGNLCAVDRLQNDTCINLGHILNLVYSSKCQMQEYFDSESVQEFSLITSRIVLNYIRNHSLLDNKSLTEKECYKSSLMLHILGNLMISKFARAYLIKEPAVAMLMLYLVEALDVLHKLPGGHQLEHIILRIVKNFCIEEAGVVLLQSKVPLLKTIGKYIRNDRQQEKKLLGFQIAKRITNLICEKDVMLTIINTLPLGVLKNYALRNECSKYHFLAVQVIKNVRRNNKRLMKFRHTDLTRCRRCLLQNSFYPGIQFDESKMSKLCPEPEIVEINMEKINKEVKKFRKKFKKIYPKHKKPKVQIKTSQTVIEESPALNKSGDKILPVRSKTNVCADIEVTATVVVPQMSQKETSLITSSKTDIVADDTVIAMDAKSEEEEVIPKPDSAKEMFENLATVDFIDEIIITPSMTIIIPEKVINEPDLSEPDEKPITPLKADLDAEVIPLDATSVQPKRKTILKEGSAVKMTNKQRTTTKCKDQTILVTTSKIYNNEVITADVISKDKLSTHSKVAADVQVIASSPVSKKQKRSKTSTTPASVVKKKYKKKQTTSLIKIPLSTMICAEMVSIIVTNAVSMKPEGETSLKVNTNSSADNKVIPTDPTSKVAKKKSSFIPSELDKKTKITKLEETKVKPKNTPSKERELPNKRKTSKKDKDLASMTKFCAHIVSDIVSRAIATIIANKKAKTSIIGAEKRVIQSEVTKAKTSIIGAEKRVIQSEVTSKKPKDKILVVKPLIKPPKLDKAVKKMTGIKTPRTKLLINTFSRGIDCKDIISIMVPNVISTKPVVKKITPFNAIRADKVVSTATTSRKFKNKTIFSALEVSSIDTKSKSLDATTVKSTDKSIIKPSKASPGVRKVINERKTPMKRDDLTILGKKKMCRDVILDIVSRAIVIAHKKSLITLSKGRTTVRKNLKKRRTPLKHKDIVSLDIPSNTKICADIVSAIVSNVLVRVSEDKTSKIKKQTIASGSMMHKKKRIIKPVQDGSVKKMNPKRITMKPKMKTLHTPSEICSDIDIIPLDAISVKTNKETIFSPSKITISANEQTIASDASLKRLKNKASKNDLEALRMLENRMMKWKNESTRTPSTNIPDNAEKKSEVMAWDASTLRAREETLFSPLKSNISADMEIIASVAKCMTRYKNKLLLTHLRDGLEAENLKYRSLPKRKKKSIPAPSKSCIDNRAIASDVPLMKSNEETIISPSKANILGDKQIIASGVKTKRRKETHSKVKDEIFSSSLKENALITPVKAGSKFEKTPEKSVKRKDKTSLSPSKVHDEVITSSKPQKKVLNIGGSETKKLGKSRTTTKRKKESLQTPSKTCGNNEVEINEEITGKGGSKARKTKKQKKTKLKEKPETTSSKVGIDEATASQGALPIVDEETLDSASKTIAPVGKQGATPMPKKESILKAGSSKKIPPNKSPTKRKTKTTADKMPSTAKPKTSKKKTIPDKGKTTAPDKNKKTAPDKDKKTAPDKDRKTAVSTKKKESLKTPSKDASATKKNTKKKTPTSSKSKAPPPKPLPYTMEDIRKELITRPIVTLLTDMVEVINRRKYKIYRKRTPRWTSSEMFLSHLIRIKSPHDTVDNSPDQTLTLEELTKMNSIVRKMTDRMIQTAPKIKYRKLAKIVLGTERLPSLSTPPKLWDPNASAPIRPKKTGIKRKSLS